MVDSVVWIEFPGSDISILIVSPDTDSIGFDFDCPIAIIRDYLASPTVHENNPSCPLTMSDGSDFVADHSFEEFFFYGWVVDFV